MGSAPEVPLTYLAAPYSGDRALIAGRMAAFDKIASAMLLAGQHPVSPLLFHSMLGQHSVPGNWAFFEAYSINLLSRCDRIVVIDLPGWTTSKGVAGEISEAIRRRLPIEHVGYCRLTYETAILSALQKEYPQHLLDLDTAFRQAGRDPVKTRDIMNDWIARGWTRRMTP